SLIGEHEPTAAAIEVRLAGRRSLAWPRVRRFVAVVFGAGDHRTPTEPQPLAVSSTWTRLASVPVAFEPPSAGFVLDWATVQRLRDRGAALVTLTHAAGISSTGDAALDTRLP